MIMVNVVKSAILPIFEEALNLFYFSIQSLCSFLIKYVNVYQCEKVNV